jgi:DNA-directed RNA polymerase subunit alpha
MVLDLQTLVPAEITAAEEEPAPTAQITVIEADDRYGKFAIEPLEDGYGITLGNPLRRVLYGSLPGTAVTWVKIEGILHEYATIPHVKEEVSEFLLNVKGIRLRSSVSRPGKLRLDVSGGGEVSAGDIMASSDFQVVNPELHLATLDSEQARLSVEFNVDHGTGYVAASGDDGLAIGVLPVDAIYTPIRKVNYKVERTRVGQRTDFERLVLEVWTDGSISPMESVRQAARILVDHFFLFAVTQEETTEAGERPSAASMLTPEQYNTPVERLELSSRTLNCLKRASIDKVGQVLELEKSELLEIRNFGEKSLTELFGRLEEMDLLPEEPAEEDEQADEAAGPAQEDTVAAEVDEQTDES